MRARPPTYIIAYLLAPVSMLPPTASNDLPTMSVGIRAKEKGEAFHLSLYYYRRLTCDYFDNVTFDRKHSPLLTKPSVIASGAKQSPAFTCKQRWRLLRHGVYPEPVEGLLLGQCWTWPFS